MVVSEYVRRIKKEINRFIDVEGTQSFIYTKIIQFNEFGAFSVIKYLKWLRFSLPQFASLLKLQNKKF